MKLYFSEMNDEVCYPKHYHLEYMQDADIAEMKLFEAKRETGTGYFWCHEYQEIGESGQMCGKQCDKYTPRNGRSGQCKHSGYCYEKTDITIILKQKP